MPSPLIRPARLFCWLLVTSQEEMTLRELRKARQLTQARVASELGITQDGVSRLEQRSDLLLSTLRKTIEAMGGSLSLVARFPDRSPVELSGIADGTPRD